MYLKIIFISIFSQIVLSLNLENFFSKEGSVVPRKPGQPLQTVALLTPAFTSCTTLPFIRPLMSLARLLLSRLSCSGVWWGLVGLEGVHIPKEPVPEQGVLSGSPDL